MWQLYFKVKGIRPGRVVVPGYGTLDFSQANIPVELCQELYENDFPYLEITQEGKEKLYGVKPKRKQPSANSFSTKDTKDPPKKTATKKMASRKPSNTT